MLETHAVGAAAGAANSGTKDEVTLSGLAERAYREADGDIAEAVAVMSDLLIVDDDIRISLIRDAVEMVAATSVRRQMLSERSSIVRHAVSGQTRANVSALAAGVARSLLDFPLSDGTPLRMASRSQVERQEAMYASQAAELGNRARWLRAILARMGSAEKVGDAIDEDTALALYRGE